jgi:hypothetical protein
MVYKMDVLDDKRARWVTPTLTRIHHGTGSCGGSFGGITESGHVNATLVHTGGSVTSTGVAISSDGFAMLGSAAASS